MPAARPINRGVLEEGQQHFKSRDEALAWIKGRSRCHATVHSKNGLVVSFDKVLNRKQINVEVWQVFIGGKAPNDLPGASNPQPPLDCGDFFAALE